MVPVLPNQVRTTMAQRDHRMHHYLWHGVRNSWEQMSPADQNTILAEFPGWAPPRPAIDAFGQVNRDNDSGEDFLYMHRQMIAEVNAILAQVHQPDYPRVTGWNPIPAPGDPDFPVPFIPEMPNIPQKTDDFYQNQIVPWQQQFTSQDYLSSVTLGQLGADIEFTIHNALHMRFAASSPVGYRPNAPLSQPVDPSWDDVSYDWLGDFYSSHVNPTFWFLHGWVDDRIEDWKQANGVQGDINWVGTWVGGPIPGMPMPMMHHFLAAATEGPPPPDQPAPTDEGREKLKKLAEIVHRSGFTGFLIDPAQIPTEPPGSPAKTPKPDDKR